MHYIVPAARARRARGLGQGGVNWSFSDLVSAAITGNVPEDVASQIAQNEAAGLVKAGASPAVAVQQSQSDVQNALETYSGPGAFGINWTGAAPNSPSWLHAAIGSIPSWAWWAAGGVGALLVIGMLRRR